MYVQKYVVNATTNASGDAVVYTPVINGRVLSIQYIKPTSGGYDDGVDFDVATEDTAVAIWSQDDVNVSAMVAPRQPTHTSAGVAALYAAEGTGVNDYFYVANERLKITVDAGGSATTGQFVVLAG